MKVQVNFIGPKKILDEAAYRVELKTALDNTAVQVVKDFNKGTETWNHRPTFPVKSIDTDNRKGRLISPGGIHKQQYLYVHNGVPGRPIFPRRLGGRLKFQSGYRSATTPGSIYSRKAQRFGQVIYRRAVLKWPGIKARNFSLTIAEKNISKFKFEVLDAMSRASRKTL